MYAVIRTGGKQYRVEHGTRVEVERLDATGGTEVTLTPVLVVDDKKVLATPSQLGDAKVTVQVVGDTKGPKIDGFTYKSKSNNRRRWGHRQGHTLVEVISISAGGKTSTPKEPAPTPRRTETSAAKKTAAKKPAATKAPAKKASKKAATTKKKAVKKPTAKKAAAKTSKKTTRKKDES